ncbi:O-antigen ligase family protein [Sulfurovum sp. XTW-4]|uniref:O-antigen ligase family protein n=1 Tax=Sulfurovum xiamenensis TaxID=3019066 RepID=A0ABT7QPK5_9BACT|nr:O-antigen ligase family protein [Sulfurovum xiamenensis]MDM5262925.1 O-antigen ligase family protein [Sulfurovum xiamenensis]
MNILNYTLDTYKKFQEKNLFMKIFQILLFIWIFSIPLKNSIYQISTVLIIIFFFIHYLYYKQKTFLLEMLAEYKKLLIVFLAFIVSMTLSSLLGISDKNVLIEILKYFFRYVLILTILFYFYKQKFYSKKWLLTVIFIVLLIHCLDGIYQYITGFDFIAHQTPHGTSNQLTGAIYSVNPFGLLMVVGASISLVLFFDKTHYKSFQYDKIIYFTTLLMFLFTLFHSQSRSAWVMFGIFSIGYMFCYIKHHGIDKKLFYTLSSLFIFSILLFLLDDNLFHRLTLLIQAYSSGRTSTIWPFTIENIIDSPILGYGVDTFKILAVRTPDLRLTALGVHNLTLELLLYTGIVGFSIFHYLIWLTLKESFTKDKIIYFILLLSFIIHMQFDGSLIDSKIHLNIFILLLFFIYSFRLDKKPPDLIK